jgi:nitrogen fixation/metabolism regulation signal transduction histidine kinase
VAVAVALAAVLLCLLGAAVVITHRIAGPAYVIARTCRRVAEGDLTEPRPLRSHDLLHDLGHEVAVMIGVLRDREIRERYLLLAAVKMLRDPASAAQAREELARQLETLASDKERRLGP